MKLLKLLLLFVLLLLEGVTSSATDKKCGNDLSNLWLDVIVVADVSLQMTDAKLTEARDSLIGLFQNDTRIGTKGYSDPRTTRVGIITYTSDVKAYDDLSKFTSYSGFVNGVNKEMASSLNSNDSFLDVALEKAEDMFEAGDKTAGRANFPKLIIVMTASLDGDDHLDFSEEIAGRLKANGVTIATVAYHHDDDFHRKLSLISSPGYNFTHNSDHVVQHLQKTATEANCICPPAYKSLYLNRYATDSAKYSQCVWSYDASYLSWANAKLKCQSDVKKGHLVTVYTKEKHDFVDTFARFRFSDHHQYFIGLHYVNGGWFWEQPENMPLVPKNSYGAWSSGFPKTSSTNVVVTSVQDENYVTSWQNKDTLYKETHRFVCQVAACDTDNFCQ